MPASHLTRRVHFLVGLAATTLSIVHEVAVWADRHSIKPYSPIGRVNEQLIDGLAVLLTGVAVLLTVRRGVRFRWIAAAALAAVSFAEFLRYFAPFPALFSVVSLADGLIVSLEATHRWSRVLLTTGFAVALLGVAAFLSASYLGAGQ